MLSIADRMRAAEKLRQSPPSDSRAESKNVEESSGNENKTSQSRVSIAEKLRAAVAIATPRQSSLDVSGKSIGNNTQPMPSIVEKMKAAAAIEKLKQKDETNETNTRPRAKTKLLAAAVAVAKFNSSTIQWGDYSYLETVDIETLSNEKLRRHLSARGLNTSSGKKDLIDRLRDSLEEEKQREIAEKLELERKHRQIADLEEQGAVYAVGKNNLGQLGLGDFDDRRNFTVIPSTRGRKCQHVSTSTGSNMALASMENHEVYCWGGGGLGPMGVKGSNTSGFVHPQLIVTLNGEEITTTALGANHAVAKSRDGDLYSWGMGDFGVLGNGYKTRVRTPKFLGCIDNPVSIIACGEQHTCIKTSNDEIYAWGHRENGRLGIGRLGNESNFQPSPSPVRFPASQVVKQIACGAEHTLASTQSTLFSWGCGDAGRLGHGSNHCDRWDPTEVTALRGSHILDISAGTWHSAVIVSVPPMKDVGYLYTFGSGYQGQLGLEKRCIASTPTLVRAFCNGQVFLKKIFSGSSHNAAISSDGNLWTWGSNKHGELGRSIEEETNLEFTPNPGIVPEFGAIVDRIGRGLPRSVAVGREYTIVATYRYDGPSEEEALEILEVHRMRDEAERKRQEVLQRAKKDELRRLREEELERKKIAFLTSKRLCTMDPKCPGFTYESSQPSICRECGFSVVYHTIVVDEDPDEDGE